jgi:hypothetical protein
MVYQFREIVGGVIEEGQLVGGEVRVRNIEATTREEAEEIFKRPPELPEPPVLTFKKPELTVEKKPKGWYLAMAMKDLEEELHSTPTRKDYLAELDKEFPGYGIQAGNTGKEAD